MKAKPGNQRIFKDPQEEFILSLVDQGWTMNEVAQEIVAIGLPTRTGKPIDRVLGQASIWHIVKRARDRMAAKG